jgi:sn-glycerol 3-phosphate transport system ATP-binding protein
MACISARATPGAGVSGAIMRCRFGAAARPMRRRANPRRNNAASTGGAFVSAIAAENVSKHWTTAEGEVRAVDGLSFEFDEGTLNVLLGPSGCGKSTTLRLIAGLEEADGGRVFIAGRDVTKLPPSQRNIAMVFQSYALFPHLSVAENIVFGLKVRKVAPTEVERRLARTAELLGLSTLLDRKPSQLSGGQQQRVALGRAIIAEAPVCLMDEPLSNLDAQLRQDMRAEIRNLQRALGITMVYVTHDQVEAMSMADRVVLLNRGRIEQNATPAELYENPANTFVARFIGTPPMNLLPLVAGPAGAVVAGTDGPAVAPAECAGMTLGVRPEHIGLRFERGLRAEVASVEYLGADSLVACRLGSTPIAVRVPGAVALARGETAWIEWPPGAQHLFDAGGARVAGEPRSTLQKAFA